MFSNGVNIPTILVVLGATGDLMTKKIAPAVFHLHEKKELPTKFRLVGVSRRDWQNSDFEEHLKTILKAKVPQAAEKDLNSFLKMAEYHKLGFEEEKDYELLGQTLSRIDEEWGQCSNKLFYLSVPPEWYDVIFRHLHQSGLTKPCGGPEEGWTRVIVEKPFGKDERTAKALDAELAKLFKEEQIYRIDHYLAKETFQNILAFRFFNNLFEDNWGSSLIESIHIRALENIGAEDRGAFYDAVGTLRDVGQNHLLQMLALATMDQPADLTPSAVRKNRAAILETLIPLTLPEVKQKTFRAQYDGYRAIKGVAPDSETETYFRAEFFLTHPEWQGVPIAIEAGKRILDPQKDEEITEVEVLFKHPKPCLCDSLNNEETRGRHFQNSLVFRQDPKEGIIIRFWSKKPGFALQLEERTFEFDLRNDKTESKSQYTEEYEKLLLDCIAGDQTLFVSSREVVAMWHFVDSILRGWHKGAAPLKHYVPDEDAIVRAAAETLHPSKHGVHSTGSFDSAQDKSGPAGQAKLKKEIGVYGLGKMGANVARHLKEKGWRVVAANRSPQAVEEIMKEGIEGAYSVKDLVNDLKHPRIIWLMIIAGKGVDELIFGKDGLAKNLKPGDTIIDAGNSYYPDTVRRSGRLKKLGINFIDVGFSGGPKGARHGGSLMVGGDKKVYAKLEDLFRDLSVPEGYDYFGPAGAGHFVKMVHNGIEYGMMQSIAEGFALMKKSPFKLDVQKIAHIYNQGSVIESRLTRWLEEAFQMYGKDLKPISGSVHYTGEGEWTVLTGNKMRVKMPAIEDAFKFRVNSKRSPSYTGKILSALRNRFGGHAIK